MLKNTYLFTLVFIFSFLLNPIFAQVTIKGKVTDASNGEAIPLANVALKSDKKTTVATDFEGYYTLTLPQFTEKDTLVAEYTSYALKFKTLKNAQKENNILIINFQLEEENTKLEEVVVKAGEDPSYPIMRKVLENKNKNDKRSLENYEYDSYVKVEIDIDNISEKFSKRKVVKQIKGAVDSLGGLGNEDGKPLIPLFISETISKFYYQKNPQRSKESVIKTKVEGVGFGDDSPITQILGNTFQEYNFYQSWMRVLGKDFVSPLADSWKTHYNYYLADTNVVLGKHTCYQIEVVPRRKADLAFDGIIWIDKTTYALKQIDVTVTKDANINFVEKIKIQQELIPTEKGAWLPNKTRVLVDLAEITSNSAGFLAKFYISSKNIQLGKKYPAKFFKQAIEVDPEAKFSTEEYWQKSRHDSLTPNEIRTLKMIDTIRNVPLVRTYTDIIKVLSSGYITMGPIDFGNYAFTYAFNDIEGNRFRLGARTNDKFSRFVELKGFGAYGIADQKFKYAGQVRMLPSRKNWTEIILSRQHDIMQAANNSDALASSGIFLASLNFGSVSGRSPFYLTENRLSIQRDIFKGYTQSVTLRQRDYEQIGEHFAYLNKDGEQNGFSNTELILESRFAKRETFYYAGNYRRSLGTAKLPILTFRYTKGFANVLNGDFSYDKFNLNLEQNLSLGILGRTYYSINASYTPSTIPYPLLEVHVGNRGVFYNFYGYGLMNFLEFVSDKHIALNMEHNFEGLFFNRIPLLKKWKIRNFITANVLTGELSNANQSILVQREGIVQPRSLGAEPYVEVGYGISNIFKFFRVTFLHRATYLDNPNIRRFGVFFSARFEL
jgi:hypothetical protein